MPGKRLASIGSTIDADAASATIGVQDSASTSSTVIAAGVLFGPTRTSTSFSDVSWRALSTAPVGVASSSRMMYSIFWPVISWPHLHDIFDGRPI